MPETGAIDVHAHYGASQDQTFALVDKFMSAPAEEVVERAARCGVRYTIVSSLAAIYAQTAPGILAGNTDANKQASKSQWLYHWVVLNPLLPECFEQANQMLSHPKCLGIKIHPEQHDWKITDHAEAVFKFAAERGAVVQSHSGDSKSCPLDYVQFADRYPEVTLVLSHLGHGVNGDVPQQVTAISKCVNHNIYTDTSSSKSIYPNLLEWAVKEIGTERILFGTDTPLYHVAMQKARVEAAQLDDSQKAMILHENALRVFGGKIRVT